MSVGDALGNNGAGWTIEHGGKVFRARAITQRVKDAFSTWMSQRVIRQFLAAQQAEGGAYAEAVGIVADRIALGSYDFHSPLAQRAMQTPEGVFRLACLVFDVQEGHGPRRPVADEEMVELLAGRGAELNVAMKLVFARSFPRAPEPPKGPSGEEGEQESADPNPRGPATEAPASQAPSPRPQSGG